MFLRSSLNLVKTFSLIKHIHQHPPPLVIVRIEKFKEAQKQMKHSAWKLPFLFSLYLPGFVDVLQRFVFLLYFGSAASFAKANGIKFRNSVLDCHAAGGQNYDPRCWLLSFNCSLTPDNVSFNYYFFRPLFITNLRIQRWCRVYLSLVAENVLQIYSSARTKELSEKYFERDTVNIWNYENTLFSTREVEILLTGTRSNGKHTHIRIT